MEGLSSLAQELGGTQNEPQRTTSEIGGYDAEFVGEVDEDFKCVVCLDVMRDPYQIVPCGHRFCRTCLRELFRSAKDNPTCPIDRETIFSDKMFPDNNCRRKILCLDVLCHHSSLGCDWKSSLAQLENHLADQCLYKDSSCANEGCDELFLKKYKEEHENTQCKWRIVKCNLCSDHFRAFELSEHQTKDCPCQPFMCPNSGCFLLIQRNKMDDHMKEDCQFSVQHCPLSCLGCLEQGTRIYIDDHMKEKARQHMELLCGEVKSLTLHMFESEKSYQNKVELMQRKIQQLESSIAKRSVQDVESLCFIWKLPCARNVPYFEELRSPVYSTGPRGYCFAVAFWKRQADTVISLRLLPGLYDSLLPWPCRCKFTLLLLDQSDATSRVHIGRTFEFDSDEPIPHYLERPSMQRPEKPLYPIVVVLNEKLTEPRYLANDEHMILVKMQVYNVETNLGLE